MADTTVVSTADANMVDYPLWLQVTGGDPAISYSGAEVRAVAESLYPQEGLVHDPLGFKITQRAAGANFSVDISAGRAVVKGDSTSNQGSFLLASTGIVNLTTPTAPASGLRVHRVIAEVLDKQASGSAYGWQFRLQEDTGSGTPALPASALDLGRVSIAAAQSSITNTNIANVVKWASPFVTGANPVVGEYGLAAGAPVAAVYQTASQNISNGSTWQNVTFGAAERNPMNAWSVSLPDRFVCPIAGSYLINGGVCLDTLSSNTNPTSASHVGYSLGARSTVAASATPTTGVAVRGSSNYSLFTQLANISTVDVRPRVVYCSRGDVIRIQVLQNWTGTMSTHVSFDDAVSFMDVTFLG